MGGGDAGGVGDDARDAYDVDPDNDGMDEGDLEIRPAQDFPPDGDLGSSVSKGDNGGVLGLQPRPSPLKQGVLSPVDDVTRGRVNVGVPIPCGRDEW